MYSYPLWLLLFVVLPTLCLWLPKFRLPKQYAKLFGMAIIGSLVFSVPWDYIDIQQRIWYFEKPHIVGLWVAGLPIEEWLFITLMTILFTTITLLVWERYGVDPDVR